jgi:hypothetical protein
VRGRDRGQDKPVTQLGHRVFDPVTQLSHRVRLRQSEKRTEIIDGWARMTCKHGKSIEQLQQGFDLLRGHLISRETGLEFRAVAVMACDEVLPLKELSRRSPTIL